MKKYRRIIIIVATVVIFFSFFGFFSIPPIGIFPQGITCFVLKSPSDPFFNSPDAISIKHIGHVSIFSRAMGIAEGAKNPIILRLPYIETFYNLSVDYAQIDH
ncbi:hypothetical protein [Pectinatus brassicae]|uniref:Uncharacterized protein n=1 Tax=Pectinatus brassicae TaxID=862415 RepID=A0A840USC5_9FIRM|nr:hypothetical protein [Pectinatus brassicae]MBB5337648.1 hypothetical protein [Pectinatus brassicae]